MIQKPFRGVQLNRTHPLAKGLVGCWLFNEATGDTAFDLSCNGNSGTLENGVAWGSDGLEFDGINDYVDVGNNPSLSPTDAFSFSGWAKPYTSAVSNQVIISHGGADGTRAFTINKLSSDKLLFYISPDGTQANRGYRVTNNAVFSNDVWAHVVAIYNNTDSQKMRIYIDGNEVATSLTGAEPSSMYDSSSETVKIGFGFNTYLDGSIRSGSVYNQAKSAEEITWLYREPYAMFKPAFNPALLYSAIPPVGAIMNQFQRANIGADLYNGVFA